jgi:hypothetical protein
MRIARSVLAVLLGIVVLVALSQAIIAVCFKLVHAPSDHIAAVQQAVSVDRLAVIVAANVVAGVLAGLVAAWAAPGRPIRHSRILAAIVALLGISTFLGGARTEGASQQDAFIYVVAVAACVAGGVVRPRVLRRIA